MSSEAPIARLTACGDRLAHSSAAFHNGASARIREAPRELPGAAVIHYNYCVAGEKEALLRAWKLWRGTDGTCADALPSEIWDEAVRRAARKSPRLVYVTMIDNGYVAFLEHFRRNLASLACALPLVVACLDDVALTAARRLGFAAVDARAPDSVTGLKAWLSKEYKGVVLQKLGMLRDACAAAADHGVEWVCSLDMDVTLLRDPTRALLDAADAAPGAAVVAQCDEQTQCTGRACCPQPCSGVMLLRAAVAAAKNSWFVLRDGEADAAGISGDQDVLVKRWNDEGTPRVALSRELFPNGAAARVAEGNARAVPRDAVLVHFNWIEGADKEVRMRQMGMW